MEITYLQAAYSWGSIAVEEKLIIGWSLSRQSLQMYAAFGACHVISLHTALFGLVLGQSCIVRPFVYTDLCSWGLTTLKRRRGKNNFRRSTNGLRLKWQDPALMQSHTHIDCSTSRAPEEMRWCCVGYVCEQTDQVDLWSATWAACCDLYIVHSLASAWTSNNIPDITASTCIYQTYQQPWMQSDAKQ